MEFSAGVKSIKKERDTKRELLVNHLGSSRLG